MHCGKTFTPPLVLTQQIYSEETNGAHAHYREPVPLIVWVNALFITNHKKGRDSSM